MQNNVGFTQQQAIKELFLQCIRLTDGEARDQFLRQLADPSLAQEVRLLLGHLQAPSPIENVFVLPDGVPVDIPVEIPVDMPPTAEQSDQRKPGGALPNSGASLPERPGNMIGQYKLLELIGEGGMGTVFMAQQTAPIKRKVAIKIIKPGMDSRQVVARFEAERQALALMDHPNIARVIDAGTSQSGRPYFVMELVRGIAITEYCTNHRLELEARLKLFVAVCQGVQHAHQRGIIHRDLKPSNILVTLHDGTPVVKIIDFGIAKAVNQDLTDSTLFTHFSQLIGTPLYMSPEQAELSGLDIDTRSDIYSLGILLYELLTGTTPFDRETLNKLGLDEVRRMIRETVPPRPSQRISTLKSVLTTQPNNQESVSQLGRSLVVRGELDWIVMKSLEKDRNRRYESAHSFAADVQRYLDDEPVQACPPSLVYRLRKFAVKHRQLVAGAGLLFISMILATLISLRYAWQAELAKRDSEAARIQTTVALEDAERLQQVANQQKEIAEERLETAESLRQETKKSRDELARSLYITDMRMASNYLRAGNIARLHEVLYKHLPSATGEDLRNWEWYYLSASGLMQKKTLFAHQNAYVAWSPDGTMIASFGSGIFSYIWDSRSGALLHKKDLDEYWNNSPTWLPAGDSLVWAVHGNRAALRSWDFQSPRVRSIYVDSPATVTHAITHANVRSVACSPNGSEIAFGFSKGQIKIWNTQDERPGDELRADCNQIRDICYSPNGAFLLAAGLPAMGEKGGGIFVWERAKNEFNKSPQHELDLQTIYESVTFIDDDTKILAGTPTGEIVVFDRSSGRELRRFLAHRDGPVNSLQPQPGGHVFASVGDGRAIHFWSTKDFSNVGSFIGHDDTVTSASWSPDGGQLCTGSFDGSVAVWEYPGKSTKRTSNSMKRGDRRTIPTDLTDEDYRDFEPLFSLQDVTDGNTKRLFAGEGNLTETQVREFLARVEREQLPIPQFFLCPNERGNGCVWSHDKSQIAITFSVAGYYSVWLAGRDGKDILPCERFGSDAPMFLSWAPDNKHLAIVGTRNTAIGMTSIVSINSEEKPKFVLDGTAAMCTACWSPDGGQLATGNTEGRLAIWDMETEELVAHSDGNGHRITCVSYSPDGKRIALATENGVVKVVDAMSTEELVELAEPGELTAQLLQWSADGRKLARIDSNHMMTIWDATYGYLPDHSKDIDSYKTVARNRSDENKKDNQNNRFIYQSDFNMYQEMLDYADKLEESRPNDFRVLVAQSQALVQLQRTEEAEKRLQQLRTLVAENKYFYQQKWSAAIEVKFLKQKNDYAKVIEIVNSLLERAPNTYQYIWNRGNALKKLGRLNEALEDSETLVQLAPEIQANWLNLASLSLDTKQLEKAYDAIERAMDLPAMNAIERDRTYWLAGRIYFKLEKFERGIERFQKVLDSSPDNGVAWGLLGDMHRGSKDSSRAIECYDKALQLDKQPTITDWLYGRGILHNIEGHQAECLSDFQRLFELEPASLGAYGTALALKLLGRSEQLIEHQRKVIEKFDPLTADDERRQQVIKILLRTSESDDLHEQGLKLANDLREKPIEALNTDRVRGIFLAKLSRHGEALECLRAASQSATDTPDFEYQFYLAMVHQQLGQREQALAAWSQGELEFAKRSDESKPKEWMESGYAKLIRDLAFDTVKPDRQAPHN